MLEKNLNRNEDGQEQEAQSLPQIVVVDDEPEIVELIKDNLDISLECEVKTFVRAANALDYILHHHVDIVISDIRMPGMDGVSLLDQIKKEKPEIPRVILISGFSEYTEKELENHGSELFLSKPLNVDDIIDFIVKSLEIS